LLANSPSDAPLRTDLVGDVVGVQFLHEDELALFMPHSGDVLLCSQLQWRQLKEKSVPAAELECTLLGLGACLTQTVT
jgi:hypothetical protein